ncbi:MAG: hypothetical protein JWN04_1113 [Myxococcaceae bacterium]|nr:hypothetical protein [Myxococcaceae bacterium]
MHDRKHTLEKPVSAQAVGLDRWDDLRVFLAVLRQGSFSAAARKLGVEQSTVSRRIAALEQSLGALLFDRQPEGPAPTELSLRLHDRALQIESAIVDLAELGRADDRAVAGKVTLALTESFAVHVVIPHVLGPLYKEYPQLAVHLLTSDRSADLQRREADLALRFYRPTSGDLLSKRVARLPLRVLAHRRYAQRAPRDPKQLRWIAVELPGIQPPQADWLGAHGITPVLTVSSHLAQVEAVRAGLGVALLTRSICKLDKNLVELEVGMPSGPFVELWLVAPRTLRSVPRVAAVWERLESDLAMLDDA